MSAYPEPISEGESLEELRAEVAELRAGIVGLREEMAQIRLLLSGRVPVAIRSIAERIPFTDDTRALLLESLEYSTQINGDAHFYRNYFLVGGTPPIRKKGKGVEYWTNGDWVEGNLTDVGRILATTMANAYAGVNKGMEKDISLRNLNRILTLRENATYIRSLMVKLLAMV